jgi:hypothetical protein
MARVDGLALEIAAKERAIARLHLVGEVGTVLGSTLDVDEALRRLARLVVPRLADWVAVNLLDDELHRRLRRAVVVHRDAERAPEGARSAQSQRASAPAASCGCVRGCNPPRRRWPPAIRPSWTTMW